jgi:hypothetical protein
MDRASLLIIDGISFGRTLIGLATRPYQTYRTIVSHGKPGELLFIGLLLCLYFALASIVKIAAFRPFLLTQQFALLAIGAASGVGFAATSIVLMGLLLRKTASFSAVVLAWSYTLIPTIIWFFATSMLYVLLPPPRTTSAMGILFSLLFIVFSATLLWWKVTLSYLALRFTLKLDLLQAILVGVGCAPIMTAWAFAMYRLGVFKVPFL